MSKKQCPSPEELEAYELGQLRAEEIDHIAGHIDQCPPCEDTVASLECEGDTMLTALRKQVTSGVVGDGELERAMSFVKEIGREATVDGTNTAKPKEETPPIGKLREYELLEKIGEGGMGAVYKARHSKLDKIVAIKVLPADKLRDDGAIARFEREMRAVGKLEHPNIVRAMDAREVDGNHFLVMEYVRGIDLSQLVKKLGPLPIADACEMIRQAAIGLDEADDHDMVHRDIKPSNLILAHPRRKREPVVKILDMGLALLSEAHSPDAKELTHSGQMMGTLDYMAPEQGGDTHNVDIRADIYSLGASLYRLLTGQVIYHGEQYSTPVQKIVALATKPAPPVQDRRPEVPGELAEVVHRMLEKLPDARYQSPEEVAESLAPFCDGHNLAALLQRSEGDDQGSPETPSAGESVAIASPDVESEVTTVHANDIRDAATVAPDVDVTIDTANLLVPEIAQVKPLIDTGAPTSAAARTKSKRAGIPPWMLIGGGVAALSLITFLGTLATIFFLQTPEGTLRVEINDPTIKVQLKGTDITFTQDKQEPIEITPGNKTLVVTRGDFTFETNRFILKNGETTVVKVDLLPGKVQVVSNDRILDERAIAGGTGEVVHDSSVNNHHGKIVGVNVGEGALSGSTPGLRSNNAFALRFDDDEKSYAVAETLKDLKAFKDTLTLEAWIKRDAELVNATHRSIVGFNGHFALSTMTAGRPASIILRYFGGHIKAGRTRDEEAQWAHFAAVRDHKKKEYRLYVNGELAGRQPIEKRLYGEDFLRFGSRFVGEISEVRVSKTARYDADFSPVYGLHTDADTIALYKFDEGSGNVLKDSSGNNHHGKIVGAKWVRIGTTPIPKAPLAARIDAAKGMLADGGELRIAVGGVQKVLKAPEEVPHESFSTMHITFLGDAELIEEQIARIVILNDVTKLTLNGPINIADLERLGGLPKLEALTLWGYTFSASDLDGVRGFAQVKQLVMGTSPFKGKPDLANFTALEEYNAHGGFSDVTRLSETSNLKSIHFFASGVTDEGLNFTTPPRKLEYISIDKCNNVTDACLIHLGRIKTLKRLHICNTKITRAGVESLQKQLPLCQINWGESYDDRIILPPLSETDNEKPLVKDAPLATRIEAAKEILASGGQVRIVVDGAEKAIKSPEDVPVKPFTVKNISFTRVESFNSKLTPRIMVFSELSELWVCGQFTIADVEQLGRLPNLEWLILGKRGRFSPADLANVRGFAQVKTLRLDSEISKGKLNLANFKALEELTVSTSVSDYTGLAELPNLKTVNFFASSVTDEGLDFQTPPKRLEILRIDKCGHVTDACLIHIGRIKTLKQIAICHTKITRAGVESLRKQLPRCEINWGESYNDRIILPPLSEADKSDN